MARAEGQKARILALLRILQQHTNAAHVIAMPEIVARLQAEGFAAERKSIYSDIEALQSAGYEIQLQKGRGGGYRLANPDFQLAEIKLLIDLVQASRFITPKKSGEMIKKLTNLVSLHDAPALRRQVYASSRIKRENESIFQSVDTLYRAIRENRQVTFAYQEWTLEKKLQPRGNGKQYTVSPWAMLWEDENYYLVAFVQEIEQIRHYRVDKMKDIVLTAQVRLGAALCNPEAMRGYAKPMFGMYGGRVQSVTFECDKDVIGALLDRFGSEVTVTKQAGGETFRLYADVAVSPPFFGWVCGFGGKVRIAAPDSLRQTFHQTLQAIWKQQTHTDAAALAHDFWQDVAEQNRQALPKYFAPDAAICWHCTNEQFTVDEFVAVNCDYPGRWQGEVQRIEQMGENLLVTVAQVKSIDSGDAFHVASFFTLQDGKIARLDEYWGDDAPAPAWRLGRSIGKPIATAQQTETT